VPTLLAALSVTQTSYRTRLGVIAALALMDPSVKIPAAGMKDVVRLLSDPDSLVRETTVKFLGNLADRESMTAAQDVLFDNLEHLSDRMRTYNTVRVLGVWLQRKDLEGVPSAGRVLSKLEDTKSRLVPAERWHGTIALIDSYLGTAKIGPK
jgi:hypothetical protein